MNSGDSKITKKNTQAQETIGKSLNFLDGIFVNLYDKSDKNGTNSSRRLLNETEKQ